MGIRCLIVDDEPPALRVLESHLARISDVEVVASCVDALHAFDRLRDTPVDLLFLDIEMPDLSGLELVRALDHPPAVIFTTAYREYAVEGFEIDAVDYLLKPISLPRLLKAIDKYRRSRSASSGIGPTTGAKEEGDAHINVRADRQVVKVRLKEILYIESLSDYVKICLTDRVVTTRMGISTLAEQLESQGFLRIHRSFLIPAARVTAFSPDHVTLGGRRLPIGRTYQRQVLARLGYDEAS